LKRTVANIYEDTREILDRIKAEYEFKSDDHAIKFMCAQFEKSKFASSLKEFKEFRSKKEQ